MSLKMFHGSQSLHMRQCCMTGSGIDTGRNWTLLIVNNYSPYLGDSYQTNLLWWHSHIPEQSSLQCVRRNQVRRWLEMRVALGCHALRLALGGGLLRNKEKCIL